MVTQKKGSGGSPQAFLLCWLWFWELLIGVDKQNTIKFWYKALKHNCKWWNVNDKMLAVHQTTDLTFCTNPHLSATFKIWESAQQKRLWTLDPPDPFSAVTVIKQKRKKGLGKRLGATSSTGYVSLTLPLHYAMLTLHHQLWVFFV